MLKIITFVLSLIFCVTDIFCMIRWGQTKDNADYNMTINMYAYAMIIICAIYWLFRGFI